MKLFAFVVLLVAHASALTVSGNGQVLVDGEMYPAGSDNTRLPLSCPGNPVTSLFSITSGRDEVEYIQVVPMVKSGLDTKDGELTIEYSKGDATFRVRFESSETSAPIRQIGGIVSIYDASDNVLLTFAVGTATYAAEPLIRSTWDNMPVTSVDLGTIAASADLSAWTFSVENAGGLCTELGLSGVSFEVGTAEDGWTGLTLRDDNTIEVLFTPNNIGTFEAEVKVDALLDAYLVLRVTVTSPVTGTCQDVTIDGKAWHDDGGEAYNCADWYNEDAICERDGDAYAMDGFTGNTACCSCGGGVTDGKAPDPVIPTEPPKCLDSVFPDGSPWHDNYDSTETYGCDYYAQQPQDCGIVSPNPATQGGGISAAQACCACGGGSVGSSPQQLTCKDKTNQDNSPWDDGFPSQPYNCQNFAVDQNACQDFGTDMNDGMNANEACCTCGGGEKQ